MAKVLFGQERRAEYSGKAVASAEGYESPEERADFRRDR